MPQEDVVPNIGPDAESGLDHEVMAGSFDSAEPEQGLPEPEEEAPEE